MSNKYGWNLVDGLSLEYPCAVSLPALWCERDEAPTPEVCENGLLWLPVSQSSTTQRLNYQTVAIQNVIILIRANHMMGQNNHSFVNEPIVLTRIFFTYLMG